MSKNVYLEVVKIRKKVLSKKIKSTDFLKVKYSNDNYLKNVFINDKIISKYFFDVIDKNIKVDKYNSFFKSPYFFSTKYSTFYQELIWNCLVIQKYGHMINEYILEKQNFEQSFFLNNYKDSKETLESIENNFGVSLWGIENRLILEEFCGDKSSIRRIIKDYSLNEKNYATFLANKIGERITDNSSFEKYSDQIQREINESNIPVEMKFFSYFWLDFHNFPENDESKKNILIIGSKTSLIDRYNIVVRMLQGMCQEHGHDSILRKCLEILSEVDDYRLEKISILAGINKKMKLKKEDIIFNSILDNYTNSEYELAVNGSERFLTSISNNFKPIEIYVKSKFLLGDTNNNLEFFPNFPLLKHASESYHQILSKSEKYYESIRNLLIITRKLGASDWAINVFDTLFFEIDSKVEHAGEKRFLNSYLNTIEDIKFLANVRGTEEYLSRFPKESATVKLWRYYQGLDDTLEIGEKSSYRKIVYEAKRIQNLQNKGFGYYIDELLKELKSIREQQTGYKNSQLDYFKEKIIFELYKMLVADKDAQTALKIVIDSYLEKPVNIHSFELNNLKNLIEHLRNEDELIGNIDVPIFMKLIESDSLSYFFENFCYLNIITEPSKISTDKFSQTRLIYFLDEVCNIEVLTNQVLIFDSFEEVLEERLKVLRELIRLNPNGERKYTEEISRISQDKLLKNLLKKVNQSKLFVDVNRIWNDKKDLIIESIKKYIDADTVELRYYSLKNNEEILLEEITSDTNSEIVYFLYESPKEKELKNVVSEILDYFVTDNEYGLDTYLSTRIRHGTLQGQLRSPFQKNNLITTRINDQSNQYVENTFINNIIEGDVKTLNKIFSDFSNEIDLLIEDVKTNWMQIKIKNKTPEGMFDYSEISHRMNKLYKVLENENNPKLIFDGVIQFLWDETELNLSRIRSKLRGELSESFIQKLTELQKSLYDANYDKTLINGKISQCKTDVQLSIDEVSSWFERVDASDDTKVNSIQILELCKIIRENISPDFHNIDFEICGHEELLMSSRELPFYVDIILILIDNALKHSQLDVKELKLEINLKKEGESIVIYSMNNFNSTNSDEVLESARKIEETIEISKRQANSLVKKEGGSGYSKIYKIIRYDLQKQPDIMITVSEDKFYSRVVLEEVGRY